MSRFALLVVAALLLLACGAPAAAGPAAQVDDATPAPDESQVPDGGPLQAAEPLHVVLDQPFELSLGATALVDETGLQVTFRDVTEDSRCPRGVTCIWAGRAVVGLDLQAPAAEVESIALATCCPPNDPRAAVSDGQAIELLDVRPAPVAGQPIESYRVELQVSRI